MRAFVIWSFLLAVTAGQASPQGRPYTEGPVVAVNYIRVKPGMFDKYMQWVATDWKHNLEAQKKEGLILDYSVYHSFERDEHDWNVVLAVTYKNMAALDNLRERAEPVTTRTLNMSPEQIARSRVERGALRDQVGGRLLRQLILK